MAYKSSLVRDPNIYVLGHLTCPTRAKKILYYKQFHAWASVWNIMDINIELRTTLKTLRTQARKALELIKILQKKTYWTEQQDLIQHHSFFSDFHTECNCKTPLQPRTVNWDFHSQQQSTIRETIPQLMLNISLWKAFGFDHVMYLLAFESYINDVKRLDDPEFEPPSDVIDAFYQEFTIKDQENLLMRIQKLNEVGNLLAINTELLYEPFRARAGTTAPGAQEVAERVAAVTAGTEILTIDESGRIVSRPIVPDLSF